MARPKPSSGGSGPAPALPLRGWDKVFGVWTGPNAYGRYVVRTSPDKRWKLVFNRGDEPAMGWCIYQFRLVDAKHNVVQAFRGQESAIQWAGWAPDSRIVAVPLGNSVLMLYDVTANSYAIIGFNAYQLKARVHAKGVRVSVDPVQFRQIFEGNFTPPPPVEFPFARLRWRPVPRGEWRMKSALKTMPVPDWPAPSKEMRAYAKAKGIALPR